MNDMQMLVWTCGASVMYWETIKPNSLPTECKGHIRFLVNYWLSCRTFMAAGCITEKVADLQIALAEHEIRVS